MTSKTPWKLVSRGSPVTSCLASPQTYQSIVSYDVHDNFDSLISADIYWNEVFGAYSCPSSSNWCKFSIPAAGADSNPLQDFLDPPDLNATPTPVPTPTCGGSPGTTLYRAIPQTIRVGTNTNGQGVQVQTDHLAYYINHGQHNDIVVPTQPPN
jgi:hypothetical protein